MKWKLAGKKRKKASPNADQHYLTKKEIKRMVRYKPTTNRAKGEFPMPSLQAICFRTCKMGSAWDTPLSDPEGLRSDASNQSKTHEGSFRRVPSTWLSQAHPSMVSSSRGLSTPKNKVYIFQSHVSSFQCYTRSGPARLIFFNVKIKKFQVILYF